MQLEFYEASELFTGIALVVGFLIMSIYARRRAATLSEDEKGLATPLYLMAFGVLSLGVASIVNFFMVLMVLTLDFVYFLFAMAGPTLLTLAAFLIIGWRRYIAIPVVLVAIGFGIGIYSTFIQAITTSLQFILGPYSLILFIIPALLFIRLTRTTKRITSFAIALLTIAYPAFPLTVIGLPWLSLLVTLFRTLAPAALGVAFYFPDVGISAEPIGYSLAYTNLGFFGSIALSDVLVNPSTPIIGISLLTLCIMFSYGTATYAYVRWRERGSSATGSLGLYFLVAGISYSISILLATTIPENNAPPEVLFAMDYFNMSLAIVTSIVLCLSAFFALDWRRSLLLPFIIGLPALIYIWSFFPSNMPVDDIPFRVIVLLLSNVTLIIVPMVLYGLIWWRMKKAGAPNRNRPLFIFFGIVILAIASGGSASLEGGLTEILPSFLLVFAYLAYWLGITGRADKLLKTAA